MIKYALILATKVVTICMLTVAWQGVPKQPAAQKPRQPAIKDMQILLRPGEVYILSFSQALPVQEKQTTRTSKWHEWMGSYVQILEQSPTRVRFRTLTLEEALRHAKQQNNQHQNNPDAQIDLEFIKWEYEHGSPFMLEYFTFPDMASEVSLMFSVETARSRRQAKEVKVSGRGVEFVPVQANKTGSRFFIAPARREIKLYLAPAECQPLPARWRTGREIHSDTRKVGGTKNRSPSASVATVRAGR